jgi:hypothetical protein
MATESDLIRFLKKNPPANKFVPYCFLSKEADALTFYFEGDSDYSKRLNDHITLFLSLETNEIVGCRIKGVQGILQDLPNYLQVNHGGIQLRILFLAFRGGADKEVSDQINELAKAAAEREMILEPSL